MRITQIVAAALAMSGQAQWAPCKLVITYKTLPSQPQFSAVFTQWNFAPRIAEPVFMPELLPGIQEIAFQKVGSITGSK